MAGLLGLEKMTGFHWFSVNLWICLQFRSLHLNYVHHWAFYIENQTNTLAQTTMRKMQVRNANIVKGYLTSSFAMACANKTLWSSLGLHSLGFYIVFVVLVSVFMSGPCEVSMFFPLCIQVWSGDVGRFQRHTDSTFLSPVFMQV